MGHSIGDGVIVSALAVAFVGYFYLKHRARQHRLELIHAERLAAMDKGIPLPELPRPLFPRRAAAARRLKHRPPASRRFPGCIISPQEHRREHRKRT